MKRFAYLPHIFIIYNLISSNDFRSHDTLVSNDL